MFNENKARELREQGRSYRAIAKELNCSHTQVYKKLKCERVTPTLSGQVTSAQQQPTTLSLSSEQVDAFLSQPHYLVPAGGNQWIVDPVSQYAGLQYGVNRFFVNPDEAILNNPTNARAMMFDLDIRGPLQERMLTAAEMEGHVECEDQHDERQNHIARETNKILEEIPNWLKYKFSLLWAIFFGKSAIQNKFAWDYSRGYKRLVVEDWNFIHPDSLLLKFDSADIAIYVGAFQGQAGAKAVTTQAGVQSRAHVVNDPETLRFDDKGQPYRYLGLDERSALVYHFHDTMPGDFYSPKSAGGIRGQGIRSWIYWTYYVYQSMKGWLTEYMEKVGTYGGILIYRFERGNQTSYDNTKALAESQSNQMVVLMPTDPGGQAKADDIQFVPIGSDGLKNMMTVIKELYQDAIRLFICGQQGTANPIPSGLGSNLADLHNTTFLRIVKYDCLGLAQSLTQDLVWQVIKWTFPGEDYRKYRYVIDCEKPDPKEFLAALKTAWEMGAGIDESAVLGVLGLQPVQAGDNVLRKQQTLQLAPQELEQQP